ncbi:hypothetical protein LXA43DRAFT_893211 [Ganoderma leucocontextum]|nr:hypothetical protein LXA43DRAFT_893211 [Ganoderma leucocontextum]
MAAPRLNVDVLAIICEFLTDVSDVLSIALTCSSVHIVAVGWLLRMRPVYLKSGPSIRRFHSFLFADAPARAPHVCVLHIDLRWPGRPQAQAEDFPLLIDIIDTCKHLENLTVAFEQASRDIAEDPLFLRAIAAIPSLRSFSVLSSSIDALALLRQVRTPLRTLGIRCQNVGPSFWYPAALERFLPRVARTLEKLELENFAVDPLVIQAGSHISQPSVASPTQYPAVRSLSVECFEGKPLLDYLQHLFPALDGMLCLSSLDMRCRKETFVHIRAVNQHAQEGNGDGSLSGAWKRLDRVVCDAPMLYVLGLRCPIRLVMIDFGLLHQDGRYVADVLRENPVPRLKLTLNHDLSALGELFSVELAETLTHLTLCLLYSNEYGYMASSPSQAGTDAASQLRWDDVLDMIVSALHPLHKLTHLRVVIGASVYVYKDASWPFAPWEEYAHSLRGSSLDFEGTAAALAHPLPSLQHVLITTAGFLSNWDEPDPDKGGRWKPYECWYISHGWRVAKRGTDGVPEGEPSLVELHDEVSETIIRKEELVLSELDEVSVVWNGARGTKLSTVFRDAGGASFELWLARLSATLARVGFLREDIASCDMHEFLMFAATSVRD